MPHPAARTAPVFGAAGPGSPRELSGAWTRFATPDRRLLALSICLQLGLALLLGHSYDTRVFLGTGYLVGTGQNPYVAQDLTAVFHHAGFGVPTTIGYPPPWPLLLGLVYRGVYAVAPDLLVYNLAAKLPVVAATIALAYLVAATLRSLGASQTVARKAWVFLLFNPALLYFGAAWGQIDAIVALLAVAALVLLSRGRRDVSAGLLALAVAFKPTAAPVVLVALAYLACRSPRAAARYAGIAAAALLVLCVAPFVVLGWDPAPILEHWNAHFEMSGAMSYTTVARAFQGSPASAGSSWLLGLAWIPALAAATVALRRGVGDSVDLLKKSTGLVLVFFLTRAWLAEPNVVLVVPLVLILTALGELDRRALTAVWVLPLVFTLFNASPLQLLFAAFPASMTRSLAWVGQFSSVTLAARAAAVVGWQFVGWWIVCSCLRRRPAPAHGSELRREQTGGAARCT